MLKYEFIKPDKTLIDVNIELINNNFVLAWKEYMFKLYERVPKIIWYITRHGYNHRYKNPNDLTVSLSRLHASFLFFHKKKIDDYSSVIARIEHLLKYPEETNQHDLNVWHRHFTTLEYKYSCYEDMTPPNTLTMDLYQYIHDVNQFTHICEAYTYFDCPRRKKFLDSAMYAVQFTNANHMSAFADNDNAKVWDRSTPDLHKGNYDAYKENNDYTVWLHEDIIGKDQMKAWLDHDDLTQFDIDGNAKFTPNVTFDPKKMYHRIINDPEFKQESLLSGKTIDRPPLGNIINIDQIDFDMLLESTVYSIKLDGRTLWHLEN